jgi:hypothetical protein
MADPVKFKISTTVAAFVRPGVTSANKLSGLENAATLEPIDRITLVYCLMKDPDVAIKQSAGTALAEMPENVVLNYLDSDQAHPAVLDAIAKAHHTSPWIARALLEHNHLSAPARSFLQGQAVVAAATTVEETEPDGDDQEQEDQGHAPVENDDSSLMETDAEEVEDLDAEDDSEESEVEVGEIDEDDERFQSKYKIALVLGISEKIKMALTGDKEWRSILIKDANKLVSGSVIKNPRITDGEILTILKVGVQNDEIVRLICANKEWTKNYMIRKALIECPKTPLPNALRWLASLNEKDIAGYAKSRNISSVLSTQAKRLLLSKKR